MANAEAAIDTVRSDHLKRGVMVVDKKEERLEPTAPLLAFIWHGRLKSIIYHAINANLAGAELSR